MTGGASSGIPSPATLELSGSKETYCYCYPSIVSDKGFMHRQDGAIVRQLGIEEVGPSERCLNHH